MKENNGKQYWNRTNDFASENRFEKIKEWMDNDAMSLIEGRNGEIVICHMEEAQGVEKKLERGSGCAVNSHAGLVDALQKIAEMGAHYPPAWKEMTDEQKAESIAKGYGPIYSKEAEIANLALAGASEGYRVRNPVTLYVRKYETKPPEGRVLETREVKIPSLHVETKEGLSLRLAAIHPSVRSLYPIGTHWTVSTI